MRRRLAVLVLAGLFVVPGWSVQSAAAGPGGTVDRIEDNGPPYPTPPQMVCVTKGNRQMCGWSGIKGTG